MRRYIPTGISRLAALLAALALCVAAGVRTAEAAAGEELPIAGPWLRDSLPRDALVYARVPHPLGLLAMPKGSVLDAALGSAANLENIRRIQQGIVDNVLLHAPAFADLRPRMLQQHLRSPLEIGAFFVPAPAVLVGATLDIDSHAGFEDLIAAFALESPGFGLLAPLAPDGVGQLTGPGVPVFLRFDARSGRLLLNAGPGVTAETFAATLTVIDRPERHRMRAMETRIDASGQGLFVWLDAEQAVPALRMFVQPEQLEPLEALGLDRYRAAALGWGVANGKGRLAVVAELPADGDRGLVPFVENRLDARSVGEPDGLILLSIPGPDEFERLEARVLELSDDETRAVWEDFGEIVRELTGATIAEAIGAIGPDVALILDEAGDYLAIRLRDARLWERMVARLSAELGSAPEERRIGRRTYYHVSVPTDDDVSDEEAAADPGWFSQLAGRQRDHFYWTRDDDFLYVASTPQVLIDRDAKRARNDVGRWLRETQRIDAKHAVLSFSGTTRKLPLRAYLLYIEILQLLSDIALADIDVWSMPTPAQLGLPEVGTIGLTVSLGDPLLSVEMSFENNPAEFIGGVGGIALIGGLAAIAVPAYQDYTTRAKVLSGLNLAAPVKADVAAYRAENGRFPPAAVAAGLSVFGAAGEHVDTIIVEADTGRIVIEFLDGALPEAGELTLEPFVQADGSVDWGCSSTLPDRYLPADCRGAGLSTGEDVTL